MRLSGSTRATSFFLSQLEETLNAPDFCVRLANVLEGTSTQDDMVIRADEPLAAATAPIADTTRHRSPVRAAAAMSAPSPVPAALLHRIRAQLHRDGVRLDRQTKRVWASLTAGIVRSLGVHPNIVGAALDDIKALERSA